MGSSALAGVPLRFLYVEGSVGGATAGHTAVRIGDAVFHHQHDGDVFRVVRDSWSRFQVEYAGFQNRPIHTVSRDIDATTGAALHEHLASVHLRMLLSLGRREGARSDRELLENWADGTAARLAGAGYFAPASAEPLADARLLRALGGSARVEAVRRRAEQRRDHAIRALGSGNPGAESPRQLRRRVAFASALQLIAESRPLADDATIDLETLGTNPQPGLSAEERASLQELASELEARADQLVASEDPLHARALMLVVARHRAVSESLRSGHLQVLDATPRGEAPVRLSRLEREEYAAAEAFAAAAVAELRDRLLADAAPGEIAWSQLEDLAARATRRGRGHAGSRERWIPERTGSVAVPWPPATPELRVALDAARFTERRIADSVASQLGYDLTTKNCVTELLQNVHQGLGGVARADAILGGPLRTTGPFGYAPFVFHRATAALPGMEVERIASFREEALARERFERSELSVALRESNVLTSAVYQRRDADGSFLLFTSGTSAGSMLTRPLFGLANIGVALGDSLLGIFTSPVDRGDRLLRGLRGAFFSLPELAFVNVRKGSFDQRTIAPGSFPAAAPAAASTASTGG